MISLFSFLHTGTAFMVIVQFRGRLVRQYRACVVDSEFFICRNSVRGAPCIKLCTSYAT